VTLVQKQTDTSGTSETILTPSKQIMPCFVNDGL
jgi:hypothetical protein